MSYSILLAEPFEKELKRLFKKYPSIKKDLAQLAQKLLQHPTMGTALGNNCYKIRLAVASKGKGKSGGARVITYVRVSKEYIYLLSIYDKSEAENISEQEIIKRLAGINP